MSSTTWTDALAGAVGDARRLRAPEAVPAGFQGTGLPFGGAVVETGATSGYPTTAPAALQRTPHNVHIDATPITFGLHSSRRPPG